MGMYGIGVVLEPGLFLSLAHQYAPMGEYCWGQRQGWQGGRWGRRRQRPLLILDVDPKISQGHSCVTRDVLEGPEHRPPICHHVRRATSKALIAVCGVVCIQRPSNLIFIPIFVHLTVSQVSGLAGSNLLTITLSGAWPGPLMLGGALFLFCNKLAVEAW